MDTVSNFHGGLDQSSKWGLERKKLIWVPIYFIYFLNVASDYKPLKADH